MSSYPHDWIAANDSPEVILRCSRCPAEAAIAAHLPKRNRPRRAIGKSLVWRASPLAPWRGVYPVPVCLAALGSRRPPHRAPDVFPAARRARV